MSGPTVSIVIPTHGNVSLTRDCLDAIAATAPWAEVVVVDNASTDGTRELLASRPGLVTVLNDTNRGFAIACNQGLDASSGEIVVYLNNDTVPHEGWLEALVAPFDDPTVGVTGARLLYPDGTIQHAGVAVTEHDGDPYPFHAHLCAPAEAAFVTERRDVQMVTGACLAVRRELARFDEAYVNGHEDLDLCLSARERGYRVVYEPACVVTHLESQTKRLQGMEQYHYVKGVDNEEARGRRRFLDRWRDRLEIDAPLSILFTMTGWADEGGGTMLPRAIAKALVRRGHRVTVLTAPVDELPGAGPYHVRTAFEDGVQLVLVHNRPSRFNDPLEPARETDDPRAVAIGGEVVRQLRPDVVHVHSLLGLSLALPAALGRPTVYTSHNYWPVCPRMYLFDERLAVCEGPSPDGARCGTCLGRPAAAPAYAARLAAGHDALGRHLAVSARVRDLFVRAGHAGDRIHVLHQQPPSVDAIWAAVGSRRPVDEAVDRPLRVGYIGSLYAHKGAHVLVEAAQAVEGIEVHLHGGGAPQYVEALRGLDRAGRCTFHGGYEPGDLEQLLASVDVVSVPSVWEDCAPLTVAEALAARAPVVGSAIGGIPEFFEDGVTGLAVRHGDVASLASALRRLVAEPGLLASLRSAIAPPRGFDAYLDDLVAHYRAAIADPLSVPRRRIDGARSAAVLAFADELASDPSLLRAWARRFDDGDDVTLVIDGGRRSGAELAALLGPAVTAAGLDGEGGADLLAVTGLTDDILRQGVHAVLSELAPPAPLDRLPRVGSSAVDALGDRLGARRALSPAA